LKAKLAKLPSVAFKKWLGKKKARKSPQLLSQLGPSKKRAKRIRMQESMDLSKSCKVEKNVLL